MILSHLIQQRRRLADFAMIPSEVSFCCPGTLGWERKLRSKDVRMLAVWPDMSAGKAHFEIGLYAFARISRTYLQRIPVVNDQGQPVADQVELGAVMLGDQPPAARTVGSPRSWRPVRSSN